MVGAVHICLDPLTSMLCMSTIFPREHFKLYRIVILGVHAAIVCDVRGQLEM